LPEREQKSSVVRNSPADVVSTAINQRRKKKRGQRRGDRQVEQRGDHPNYQPPPTNIREEKRISGGPWRGKTGGGKEEVMCKGFQTLHIAVGKGLSKGEGGDVFGGEKNQNQRGSL